VKAVVVLRPGARLSAEELALWCREKLSSYKVPRLFTFMDALPKSPTGKVAWRPGVEGRHCVPSALVRLRARFAGATLTMNGRKGDRESRTFV